MKIQKIKIKTKIVNQTIIKQMLNIPFLPILHVLTSCYHDPITFYQFYQQSNKQQVILTVKPTETQCSYSKLFKSLHKETVRKIRQTRVPVKFSTLNINSM